MYKHLQLYSTSKVVVSLLKIQNTSLVLNGFLVLNEYKVYFISRSSSMVIKDGELPSLNFNSITISY